MKSQNAVTSYRSSLINSLGLPKLGQVIIFELMVLAVILVCKIRTWNYLSLSRGQAEDVIGTQEKQILDTILNDRYYDKNFRPGRANYTGGEIYRTIRNHLS